MPRIRSGLCGSPESPGECSHQTSADNLHKSHLQSEGCLFFPPSCLDILFATSPQSVQIPTCVRVTHRLCASCRSPMTLSCTCWIVFMLPGQGPGLACSLMHVQNLEGALRTELPCLLDG